MLYQQVRLDMTTAQKAGDARLLGVLRLIWSELSYAQVDFKEGELPDEEVVRVLTREAKKRKESIEIFEKAGAQERVDQEQYELGVITKYLPEQMSEAEVEKIIDVLASETGFTGGRLVGAVMGKLKGKVDGGVVNRIVNEKYKS